MNGHVEQVGAVILAAGLSTRMGQPKMLMPWGNATVIEKVVNTLLETGIHQHEAIGLYERMGFQRIPPFGAYQEDPLSRFYEKQTD